MSFRTLSRTDSEFKSHLLGTFSKKERALPVQSLNMGTDQEEIVFKIVSLAEIQQPKFFKKWIEVFKLHHLLWVLAPAFLVLAKIVVDEISIDLFTGGMAISAVVFLLLGSNLYNDFLDHVSGIDRMHSEAIHKAIQKGWVTAAETQFWAFFFLSLGFVVGLYPLLERPSLLLWIVFPTVLLLIQGVFSWKGFKYRWSAEFALFWLLGPLLSIGYGIAWVGDWDLETAFIGWLCGWMVVLTLHLKNFEHILVGGQHGLRNTMAYLGFERSKRLIEFCWIALCLQFLVFHLFYTPSTWSWIALAPALISLQFLKQLRKLDSPAGSHIKSVVRMGRICVSFLLGCWLLMEAIYFIW